jgi:Arc/MetJ-type ribon-helix-helix transcriptional regulator
MTDDKTKTKYTTVHIPKSLSEIIKVLVKSGLYSSNSEFVKEAIRERLIQLGLKDLLTAKVEKP